METIDTGKRCWISLPGGSALVRPDMVGYPIRNYGINYGIESVVLNLIYVKMMKGTIDSN